MEGESLNIIDDKKQRLQEIYPEIFTEGKIERENDFI